MPPKQRRTLQINTTLEHITDLNTQKLFEVLLS